MKCNSFELKRKNFKPYKVRVLFIGESPPANGTFFYCGNSNLARYTKEGFEIVFGDLGDMSEFLRFFQKKGCYLVDLCSKPINRLGKSERNKQRNRGVENLSSIIEELKPERIVVVMKGIKRQVKRALGAKALKFDIEKYSLPFPAFGHQKRYLEGLAGFVKEFRNNGIFDDC